MSRLTLKILLMIFMTMDHIAFAFLSYTNPWHQVFRFFGRMVAPVMCYLLVEGYQYTSSKLKYLKRMLAYAVVAYVPYVLLEHPRIMLDWSHLFQADFNMLFTLSLCLIMLMVLENISNESIPIKLMVVLSFALLTLKCDWFIFAPCYVASFYLFKSNQKIKWVLVALITLGQVCYTIGTYYTISQDFWLSLKYGWFGLGAFIIMFIEYIYNHQESKTKFNRLFYIYYPLHLAIINLIQYIRLR